MKKERLFLIYLSLILILFIASVSANIFFNFLNGITGKSVENNHIIINESGNYYLKLKWYNSAAYTYLYLNLPKEEKRKIGEFYGNLSETNFSDVYLGYFNQGDDLELKSYVAWNGNVYPYHYSSDINYYKIEEISNSRWWFKYDDGLSYGNQYDDGEFEVYLSNNPPGTCTDTDGGKDYFTRGTVKFGDDEITDFCYDDDIVVEHFCTDKGIGTENYTCPDGCDKGACVKSGYNLSLSLFLSKDSFHMGEKITLK